MHVVLLGSPGAGKGTQARFISERYRIPQIATGDILRSAIKAGSPLGKKVKQIIDDGQLVADDIMIELVKERIQQDDCKNGFLLDGYPRTIKQAESLNDHGIRLDCIIEIKVPDTEVIKRLSGRRIHPASGRVYHLNYNPPKEDNKDDITGEALVQRPDDQEQTVLERLRVYQQQTQPLVNHYKSACTGDNKPQYVEVDGTVSMDKVKKEIFNILDKIPA